MKLPFFIDCQGKLIDNDEKQKLFLRRIRRKRIISAAIEKLRTGIEGIDYYI